VVRFAEIQVHQQPLACCRFVAEVVASLNPGFVVPSVLQSAPDVAAIPQWTQEQAQQWSQNKYRESYLGIEKFGEVNAPERGAAVLESEIGKQEEAQVHEEPALIIPKAPIALPSPTGLLSEAVRLQQYVSFHYEGKPTVTKPSKYDAVTEVLTAYCYVKNEDRVFQLAKMSALRVKPTFYSAQLGKPALTAETVRALVQVAIRNGKYIRMSYTTSSWNAQSGEKSLRTISDVQRSVDALPADRVNSYNLSNTFHISAHCHKRDDQRTFHYDRIGEIAILDL
jgi:predicted DNA-binding transcriptional regulator YafY